MTGEVCSDEVLDEEIVIVRRRVMRKGERAQEAEAWQVGATKAARQPQGSWASAAVLHPAASTRTTIRVSNPLTIASLFYACLGQHESRQLIAGGSWKLRLAPTYSRNPLRNNYHRP